MIKALLVFLLASSGMAAQETDTLSITVNPIDERPKLKKKLKDGTYIYNTKETEQKESAGFRMGPFNPINLEGDTPGITFETIYGTVQPFWVGIDYEYQLFKSAGKFGLRPSFGFFTASGNGRFKSNINGEADETVTLYGLPLAASAVYHLQFWDRQLLVPYGEIGGDYIVFFEQRPDKEDIKESVRYAGALAWHWAAGMQIQLDFLDKEGLWQIDSEYGINHIYFTAGVRQIIGLNSTFDFTSLIYEGGFLFEF